MADSPPPPSGSATVSSEPWKLILKGECREVGGKGYGGRLNGIWLGINSGDMGEGFVAKEEGIGP